MTLIGGERAEIISLIMSTSDKWPRPLSDANVTILLTEMFEALDEIWVADVKSVIKRIRAAGEKSLSSPEQHHQWQGFRIAVDAVEKALLG